MQQEGGGSQNGAAGEGGSTGNTGGLGLKRSFQEYADQALEASCAQQGEAASRRRMDVLSRCRVQGRLQRECILSGLASATKVRAACGASRLSHGLGCHAPGVQRATEHAAE